ncbi:MAG: T9SS type A sorting domain-containing protein, partial [Rhodothermia bacterium]
ERRGHMGLARLRRDGFASLDADENGGMLTTRPMRFDYDDGFLFVNVDAQGGELRVEVIDENGIVVPDLALIDCIPLGVDSTRKMVTWASARSLGRIRGSGFRLRFELRSTRLFSFWVSPSPQGTSNGFLAAGGPRYLGYRDNVIRSSTGVDPDDASMPSAFALLSNAPNPFSSETLIRYRLVWPQMIDLSVYDLLGRHVATLARGVKQAGLHEVRLSGAGLAPGVYLCRLTSTGREDTIRIVRAR